MVSFDGIEKIHNKYRPFKNGKGSFDLVAKNIKKLSKHLLLQGRGTIVKETIKKTNFENIIKNSKSCAVNSLALSPVDCTKIKNKYLSLSKNDMQKLYDLFEKIAEKNFQNVKKGFREKVIFDPYANLIRDIYNGRILRRYKCGAFFGMATVSTDGNIYPCHRFVGLDNFIIGNVFEGIDNGKMLRFLEDLEKAKQLSCFYCWLNKIY